MALSVFYGKLATTPEATDIQQCAKLREMIECGNGLIDAYERDGLDIAIDTGRGGILLRLTDEQFQALGGVL